ncbi:MAG: glutathione S-transferase N-terminal domain-containing protein [Pseudomonadota bacterium]
MSAAVVDRGASSDPHTLRTRTVDSPFVWRATLALASMGLAYQPKRLPFTEIADTLAAHSKTVPVLHDEDGTYVADSWAIAEYLDRQYTETPSLLGEHEARARNIDNLISAHAFPGFFPLYIRDIWLALPEDQASYFRDSRETRFGTTLEELSADRDARLPAARDGIQPLRDAFDGKPWLHGDTPGYGDHIALAFFVWIKSVAQTPPLAAGDPLLDWLERGFALYNGAAGGCSGGPWTD